MALITYKTHGGAFTALDYGIGNATAALDAAWPYLIVFVGDNGGPLPHSTNAPYRGGKHTLLSRAPWAEFRTCSCRRPGAVPSGVTSRTTQTGTLAS